MEDGEPILGILAWTMMVFTLGASVTWRLEGRRPLVAPLWLVVVRGLSFFVMTLFVVVSADPPSGIATIEPAWWNAAEVLVLDGALALLVRELRHTVRREAP